MENEKTTMFINARNFDTNANHIDPMNRSDCYTMIFNVMFSYTMIRFWRLFLCYRFFVPIYMSLSIGCFFCLGFSTIHHIFYA